MIAVNTRLPRCLVTVANSTTPTQLIPINGRGRHTTNCIVEQHAETFCARFEAYILTKLIAGYPAKPAAPIDFQRVICFADVDVRLLSAVRFGLPIKLREY
jgi:hypothetical protein